MQSKPKILLIRPDRSDAVKFVETLASEFAEWEIKMSNSGMATQLFEIKKYDLAHFFLPVGSRPKLLRKGSKTKVVQTLLSGAQNDQLYKDLIFADCVITFCEQDKKSIQQQMPRLPVENIPPCAPKAPVLASSAELRAKLDIGDRLLVTSLSDFSDHDHFSAFLYTAREYQRRGGFRFLLPVYNKNKESLRWRESLNKIVDQEKLTLTTFVDDSIDPHSLIDASDFCLHVSKKRDQSFDFPLQMVEALCAGKPVICFNQPPVNEFVASFNKEWIANVNEDYSRISRDLLKHSSKLEQISTDLARFARSRLSAENVAGRYRELYKSLLSL